MTLPLICTFIAAFATLLSFFLGMGKGILVLIVTFVVVGILAYTRMTNEFGAMVMVAALAVPFLALACGMGLASGALFKGKQFFFAVLILMPFPLIIFNLYSAQNNLEKEQPLLNAWVENNKEIIALVGGGHPQPSLMAQHTDIKDGSRYQFHLGKKYEIYVVVDSSWKSGKSKFKIACVATPQNGVHDWDCDKVAYAFP